MTSVKKDKQVDERCSMKSSGIRY